MNRNESIFWEKLYQFTKNQRLYIFTNSPVILTVYFELDPDFERARNEGKSRSTVKEAP